MRTGLRVVALAFAGLSLVWLGLFESAPSEANQYPSACVYAEIGKDGTTSTTKVDTDGTTCPSLPPPTTGDPCPGGQEVRDKDTNAGVGHDVMVCLKGL